MDAETGRRLRAKQRPIGDGDRLDAAAWLVLAAVVALALGLEVGLEGRDPFWLDESWTGAIAATRGWRATFQQIYWDVNAPLYYGLIRVWSAMFGLSDVALRAPSLIFAALTPCAAALPTPGLTRGRRLAWAALLAFWFPALCYAQEARCYALLLCVCTLQTCAYARLMQAPDVRRAWAWSALAATAILTHYDALYLGAAQGVLLLARHPRRALACWPAGLAFVPAFGWLAFHWPRIAEFARPGVAWYSPLTPAQLPTAAAYLLDGGGPAGPWLAGLAVSTLSLRLLLRSHEAPEPAAQTRGVGWAVGAAALAAAAILAVGFLRPSFTLRYLTPSAPGLLLGLVWLASAIAGRRLAPVVLCAVATVYLGVSGSMLQMRLRMAPKRYAFEAASAAIAKARPARLAFLWDHPVDPILHPSQLSGLGGFFLRRDGLDIPVDAVVLRPGEDPTRRLMAEAAAPNSAATNSAAMGSAVLWLYDEVVHGTAARLHPPDMLRLDARFHCRDFGGGRFGVLACVPRADPAPGTSGVVAHQPPASQPHGRA